MSQYDRELVAGPKDQTTSCSYVCSDQWYSAYSCGKSHPIAFAHPAAPVYVYHAGRNFQSADNNRLFANPVS